MTNSTPKNIIDRINALHNLAGNNPNENEVAAALALAQKLMIKHQISQLILDEAKKRDKEVNDEYVSEEVYGKHFAIIIWKHNVIVGICEINGCFLTSFGASKPREAGVTYIAHGRKTLIENCKILIDHIINQIEYLSNAARQRGEIKKKDETTSFKLGCATRIVQRLKETKLEAINESKLENQNSNISNALVAFDNELKNAETWARKKLGELKKGRALKSNVRAAAYEKGKKSGDLVDLNLPKKKLT